MPDQRPCTEVGCSNDSYYRIDQGFAPCEKHYTEWTRQPEEEREQFLVERVQKTLSGTRDAEVRAEEEALAEAASRTQPEPEPEPESRWRPTTVPIKPLRYCLTCGQSSRQTTFSSPRRQRCDACFEEARLAARDYHRRYHLARSRAIQRLTKEHPSDFKRLFDEETERAERDENRDRQQVADRRRAAAAQSIDPGVILHDRDITPKAAR